MRKVVSFAQPQKKMRIKYQYKSNQIRMVCLCGCLKVHTEQKKQQLVFRDVYAC